MGNDRDDGPSYVTKENGRMGNDMGDGLSYAGDGNGPACVDLDDGLCYAGKGNGSLLFLLVSSRIDKSICTGTWGENLRTTSCPS